MKNPRIKVVAILAIAVAIMSSCSKTPEEKINAMIGELVQNNLFIPDSYDPVETKIDSAFAPYDDPLFRDFIIKSAKELDDLNDKLRSCDWDIESAETSMDIYSDSWSRFSQGEYRRAKDDYNEAVAEKADTEKQISSLIAEIKERMKEERHFIGYKAAQSYRAENNYGYTTFGYVACIFDKELTKITAAYDMEGQDYTIFINFMENAKNGDFDTDISTLDLPYDEPF